MPRGVKRQRSRSRVRRPIKVQEVEEIVNGSGRRRRHPFLDLISRGAL